MMSKIDQYCTPEVESLPDRDQTIESEQTRPVKYKWSGEKFENFTKCKCSGHQ